MVFFPIKREGPNLPVPAVLVILIILNSLVWCALYLLSYPVAILGHYGFVPGHPRLLTLFSALFLHIALLPVLLNMFFWARSDMNWAT